MREVYFMPLGGGQNVGASCYYLQINGCNIILDAGIGMKEGIVFHPDLFSLQETPLIQSLGQIDQIFISHAHVDHVGYLFELMGKAFHAPVYMTEITKLLTEYQMYDKRYLSDNSSEESGRLAVQRLLDQIKTVTYMKTIDMGKYKVSFYPAGHIPGAMMTLFEVGRKKVLYTGDYSIDDTMLTTGCYVPENMDIDVLIMCGLHAKHPEYERRHNGLEKTARDVLRTVKTTKRSVRCQVAQLSKGIEFLKALNENDFEDIPIYVDENLMKLVRKMEQLFIPVFSENDKCMDQHMYEKPHVFLTTRKGRKRNEDYVYDRVVDFSLHEDFEQMKKFIKKVNPRQAVIVHCARERCREDETIENQIMYDPECRTQFIFAENKILYQF